MTPIAWLVLFAALQLADAMTTRYILTHGGRELLGPMRKLMQVFGTYPALFGAKAILVLAMWFWLTPAANIILPICNIAPSQRWLCAMSSVLAMACVLYAGVVAWNLSVIWRMRRQNLKGQ